MCDHRRSETRQIAARVGPPRGRRRGEAKTIPSTKMTTRSHCTGAREKEGQFEKEEEETKQKNTRGSTCHDSRTPGTRLHFGEPCSYITLHYITLHYIIVHHRTCMSGNPPRRSRTCRDGVAHKGLVSLTLRSNCRMPPPRGGAAAPCAAASAPSRAASRRAARAPSRARCARRTSRATEACTSPCPAAAAAAAACRAARRASRRPRKGWRRTWGRRARNAERTDATFFFSLFFFHRLARKRRRAFPPVGNYKRYQAGTRDPNGARCARTHAAYPAESACV